VKPVAVIAVLLLAPLSFAGTAGDRFVARLAQVLPNRKHTLELIPIATGAEADIEALEVYRPPLLQP
jgi:hypothetical protein